MEDREENQDHRRNMAEAAVESPVTKFYCHRCTAEISPILPDYICPQCQSGFIEELSQSSSENNDLADEEDIYAVISDESIPGHEDVADGIAQVADLWNLLYTRRPAEAGPAAPSGSTQSQESRDRHRPGPSRRRLTGRLPRRTNLDQDTARSRTEGFLQHLVSTLSENAGLGTGFPVFLNLASNPGDYAWGRGGWNAIITQLINQLDGTGPPPLPKEKIDEIPFVNILQEQVDKNLQCTVCMEDYKLDESVRRLTCDHHFHTECITPWLELHGTCPICRKLLAEGAENQENAFPSPQVMSQDPQNPNPGNNPRDRRQSDSYAQGLLPSVYDFTDDFD